MFTSGFRVAMINHNANRLTSGSQWIFFVRPMFTNEPRTSRMSGSFADPAATSAKLGTQVFRNNSWQRNSKKVVVKLMAYVRPWVHGSQLNLAFLGQTWESETPQ